MFHASVKLYGWQWHGAVVPCEINAWALRDVDGNAQHHKDLGNSVIVNLLPNMTRGTTLAGLSAT